MPLSELVNGIHHGDRRCIAKAITLIESENSTHALLAAKLLRLMRDDDLNASNDARPNVHCAIRTRPVIAITGAPGSGKSCFIEALGTHLVEGLQQSVGVLAVDPTSAITGGSILGDKTRMSRLSMNTRAFIRPSPSGCHLGGMTARAWETIDVFEAARFDVTLIETVGVGQSETQAKDAADLLVLLVPPASGDDLQAIKKGIAEVADVILVTKADGDRCALAEQTRLSYTRGVQLDTAYHPRSSRELAAADGTAGLPADAECRHAMRSRRPVLTVSSETGLGIQDAWTTMIAMWRERLVSGEIEAHRGKQRVTHFKEYLEGELWHRAKARLNAASWNAPPLRACENRGVVSSALPDHSDVVGSAWDGYEARVRSRQMSPREAGNDALARFFSL